MKSKYIYDVFYCSECLLDQRIVGLVQSCNSARTLATVVRLIETSALEESPAGTPQQVCSFLQQCGFAGLWRYAGSFLSPVRLLLNYTNFVRN